MEPNGGILNRTVILLRQLPWLGVVAANSVPALGVLFFGWDAFLVVFVYWLENAVIGFFTVLRISFARPGAPPKGCLVPFFMVHYGMFMLVHLVFVVVLLGFGDLDGSSFATNPTLRISSFFDRFEFWTTASLIVAVASLVIEHGYDFRTNYLQSGEFERTDPGLEMFKPYSRVIVLHLAILIGGFAFVLFQLPRLIVLLLVALKIGLELRQQRRSNRRP